MTPRLRAKPYRDLPAQLRLTGREAADPAAVKALGAGIIVDFGTVDGRYAGIAERTQAATGIAYILIDGALARTAAAYRELGRVVRAGPRAEMLAGKSGAMLDEVAARVGGLPRASSLSCAVPTAMRPMAPALSPRRSSRRPAARMSRRASAVAS